MTVAWIGSLATARQGHTPPVCRRSTTRSARQRRGRSDENVFNLIWRRFGLASLDVRSAGRRRRGHAASSTERLIPGPPGANAARSQRRRANDSDVFGLGQHQLGAITSAPAATSASRNETGPDPRGAQVLRAKTSGARDHHIRRTVIGTCEPVPTEARHGDGVAYRSAATSPTRPRCLSALPLSMQNGSWRHVHDNVEDCCRPHQGRRRRHRRDAQGLTKGDRAAPAIRDAILIAAPMRGAVANAVSARSTARHNRHRRRRDPHRGRRHLGAPSRRRPRARSCEARTSFRREGSERTRCSISPTPQRDDDEEHRDRDGSGGANLNAGGEIRVTGDVENDDRMLSQTTASAVRQTHRRRARRRLDAERRAAVTGTPTTIRLAGDHPASLGILAAERRDVPYTSTRASRTVGRHRVDGVVCSRRTTQPRRARRRRDMRACSGRASRTRARRSVNKLTGPSPRDRGFGSDALGATSSSLRTPSDRVGQRSARARRQHFTVGPARAREERAARSTRKSPAHQARVNATGAVRGNAGAADDVAWPERRDRQQGHAGRGAALAFNTLNRTHRVHRQRVSTRSQRVLRTQPRPRPITVCGGLAETFHWRVRLDHDIAAPRRPHLGNADCR